MNTPKDSRPLYRFVILVPHRDATLPFQIYREKLFASGYYGAFSFPLAAPLAALSGPLARDELKELGRNIRGLTKANEGKISGALNTVANFYDEFAFFGPRLNLQIEESLFGESARGKLLHTPESAVLCAALLDSGANPVTEGGAAISFRSAFLANLAIRPLDSGERAFSFEWKIGGEVWLPKFTSRRGIFSN